jgi:hypothetical protein
MKSVRIRKRARPAADQDLFRTKTPLGPDWGILSGFGDTSVKIFFQPHGPWQAKKNYYERRGTRYDLGLRSPNFGIFCSPGPWGKEYTVHSKI